jgi:arabinofuranosyltransferase
MQGIPARLLAFFACQKKILFIAISFAAAAYLLSVLYPGSRIGIDDANIFFSYAKNLAAGNGIAYGANLELVEGYTSTLWMLLCSFLFFVHANETGIFFLSISLAVFSATLCLAIIKQYANFLEISHKTYDWIFLVLVLASPSYLLWITVSLMDSALWGAILVSMFYVLCNPPHVNNLTGWFISSLPFILSPLARPEALVVTPFFLMLLWFRIPNSSFVSKFKIFSSLSFAFVVSVVALTLFRILYFGYPLPSTFYAKVSPSVIHNLLIGYPYAINFLTSNLVVGLSVLAIISSLFFKLKLANSPFKQSDSDWHSLMAYVLPLIIAVLILLPVLTGGDHFALSRFYQPVYPLFCLVLVLTVMQFSQKMVVTHTLVSGKGFNHHSARQVYLLLTLGAWLCICVGNPSWLNVATGPKPLANEFSLANSGRAKGNQINDLYIHDVALLPRVGVIVAGGFAVTYKGATADLMGLNNSYMAHFPGSRTGPKNHAAFEKAAFYNLAVDYIDEDPNDWFLVQAYLKNLFYDEQFYTNWTYGTVSERAPGAKSIKGFFSNTYIKKLGASSQLRFTQTLALDTKTWTGRWLKVGQ